MPKPYPVPLAFGWAGIYQAGMHFDNELIDLIIKYEVDAEKNAALLPILNTLHLVLQQCVQLYQDYENRTSPEWVFIMTHSVVITQIAWALINLKPSDPENLEDVVFAQTYIDFLESLKTLPNPPEMPYVLKQILNITLVEFKDITDKDLLFKKLCDKAIETQQNRMGRYNARKADTVNSCNAYSLYIQQPGAGRNKSNDNITAEARLNN